MPCLLRCPCRLTDTEVESNVINLLFAGHDTSSSTLAMIMCHLTTHPHVMERLRQEQQQVVAKYGPAITPSALKAMPYAEAVIRWVASRGAHIYLFLHHVGPANTPGCMVCFHSLVL
jgi:hypothetical protein